MAAPVIGVSFLLLLFSVVAIQSVEIDEKGYVVFCPCMGRFGNQADHYLGALAFAKDLDRTLILPPWVEYRGFSPRSTQISFNSYFKVEALKGFHRVILMEEFMNNLAPTIWPPGDRTVFCYRQRGNSGSCNAKDGNPFGPFWDTFDIDFDKSEFYGPLYFNTDDPKVVANWHKKYPASAYPVLAFTGAPASFPVAERNVPNQQYFVWSSFIQRKADVFIEQHIGKNEPFLGVHLRNGSDFKNACGHVNSKQHLFASPQCLGYNYEHGHVTDELCYPSEKTVISQIKKVAKKIKAKTVFLATDQATVVNRLTKLLKPLKLVGFEERIPHVDLAILGMADHFIGNCVSSFTAFAARERKVKNKPTSFWAFNSRAKVEL